LTLNALTAACNQKSNRDPVLQLDAKDVVRALDGLRAKKLAWEVTSAGARVLKYGHGLRETLPLTRHQQAVLCELLVRGPQTVGELRGRAARMAEFTDTAHVQTTVQELVDREGGALAVKLRRGAGQREERFAHLLCGPPEAESASEGPVMEEARVAVLAENERIAALEQQVTALRAEVAQLKTQLADLVRQLQ
jgi:uncharacterized protein YceH (UPF0502 family)